MVRRLQVAGGAWATLQLRPCSPTIKPPPVSRPFLDAWKEDPNLVWYVRTSHLIHPLEAAAVRIEAWETLLSEIEGAQVGTDVGTNAADPLGTASGRGTQPAADPNPASHRVMAGHERVAPTSGATPLQRPDPASGDGSAAPSP